MKKGKFTGKFRLFGNLIFGILDNNDTVILGDTQALSGLNVLKGAEIEYKKVSKAGDPDRFQVQSMQLT